MSQLAMTPESLSPDLLEQAQLLFLQGNFGQARSFLDRLVSAEPNNAPAQELRASVIAKQAALRETEQLQAGNSPNALSQTQTGSIWTRPITNDPVSTLLNSSSARKWPKPVLLVACLLAGIVTVLLPGHHGFFFRSWHAPVILGLAIGLVVFIIIVVKKR